ncbi:MAG: ATP-binding protein [Fastidiosipilaceae bacterium]|jgi:signal transduction histidine kinase
MTIVIFSILTSALLTLIVYSVTSNWVFRNVSANNMRSRAAYISNQTTRFVQQDITDLRYNDILVTAGEMTNSCIAVFLYRDPVVVIKKNANEAFTEDTVNDGLREMLSRREVIESSKSIDFTIQAGEDKTDVLIVGFPVEVTDIYSDTRSIEAGVFIMQSFDDIAAGYSNLNLALILSSSIAFLLMIFPVFRVANHLVKPINQTRDVALAMSNGNFSLRADASQQGEVGELAQAINNLASDLDRTVGALMSEKNRLQQILDGLNEGILAIDEHDRITLLNPALFRLLGFNRHKLSSHIRRSDDDDDPESLEGGPEDSGTEPIIDQQIDLKSGALSELIPEVLLKDFEQVLSRQSSHHRTIQIKNRVLFVQYEVLKNANDERVGVMGLFRDITESEKLEQTRRDYVANISHELRTPLTAMRALIEPLQDGMVKSDEDRQRYYSIIHNETIRLTRLIDDMLELSRIQAGQLPLERVTFRIDEVVESIENKFGEVALKADIELDISPELNELSPLFSNPDRLEQVLVILIDNALKFTPANGTISIWGKELAGSVEISVQDTGEGISQEDCEHIFERFYKVDKARGRSGTGLGLSIASEIVRLLGGQISVHSEPGVGSRFSFTIPTQSHAP